MQVCVVSFGQLRDSWRKEYAVSKGQCYKINISVIMTQSYIYLFMERNNFLFRKDVLIKSDSKYFYIVIKHILK